MKVIIEKKFYGLGLFQKPRWLGFSYFDDAYAVKVYYLYPLNWLVRCWREIYWRFLSAAWWVGLIDIGAGGYFTWGAFFRVKVSR